VHDPSCRVRFTASSWDGCEVARLSFGRSGEVSFTQHDGRTGTRMRNVMQQVPVRWSLIRYEGKTLVRIGGSERVVARPIMTVVSTRWMLLCLLLGNFFLGTKIGTSRLIGCFQLIPKHSPGSRSSWFARISSLLLQGAWTRHRLICCIPACIANLIALKHNNIIHWVLDG
jgi:hypothetical protein